MDSFPTSPFWFAYRVSRPYWYFAIPAFVLVIFAASFDTFTYYVYKQLVDSMTAYTEGRTGFSTITFWILMFPAAVIGHQFMYRLSGLFGMQWMTRARKKAADMLFEYLTLHSMPYFHNRFAGSLGSKIWNAHGGMHGAFETVLWNYTPTLVTALASAVLVSTVDWRLALFFGVWIVGIVVVNVRLTKRSTALSEERAAVKSKATGLIVDVLTNIVAVKNYAQRTREIASVDTATSDFNRVALKAWYNSEWILIWNNILMGIFVIGMLFGAFFLWRDALVTTGELIMILAIVSGIMGWFTFIGSSINQFAERYGEVDEGLKEVVRTHDIVDSPSARDLTARAGSVEFDNVTFAYNQANVFESFSLTIKPGTRVGLVGPSGSGKTTFVSLLLRQHDVKGGAIRIDGMDVREVTQDSLHRAIAVVPQDPSLFHRTIRENIAYGQPQATIEEVMEAARRAEAHEFIQSLPDGYDTLVGERGVKLSGGQRQRVAIARAILKAAPVLILDEATSSLDSESEASIQVALKELMEGKTVIAIAHRLSTIRAMDRILVLENGKMVEDGTHDELVAKTGGLYARLWTHQAGGFLEE
ncbi:MAG: ABC transporter ATP-binding protein [Patescibacteria group bacterium]